MEAGKQKTKRAHPRGTASNSVEGVSGAVKISQAGGSRLQMQMSSATKKAERQSASAEGRSSSGGGREVARSSDQENLGGQERVDLKAEGGAAAREPEGSGEAPVVKLGKRKAGDEIDSIFGKAKVKKKGSVTREDTGADIPGSKAKVSDKTREKIGGGKEKQKLGQKPKVAKVSSARKRTNDGLTVYSEEELGFARKDAGGTPLCPFDCQCCF